MKQTSHKQSYKQSHILLKSLTSAGVCSNRGASSPNMARQAKEKIYWTKQGMLGE